MFFNNYLIFIYILSFVLVYNLAKRISGHRIVRDIIIFFGNLFILLTLVKEHTIIVLIVLSFVVFLIGRILQKKTSKSLLITFLSLFIIAFSIRNYPYVQELISDGVFSFLKAPILSVQKIGLSYILFRYVHFLVESYNGTIQKSNFLTFCNYILFFPSILAGPIDTYKNFHYWLENTRRKYHQELFFAGITRIFIGAVKTIGIVPLIINYATDYHELMPEYSALGAITISSLAYSAYIYLDFSGYTDIAVGTAYLIGIKSPENFNNPYISHNLSDFWKRWHMTFSNFLKLYVFKPFIKLYNKLFNPKYRLSISILCYLSTFLICGLWHGDKINFVYWGLWHGLGLALNKVWMLKAKPHLSFADTKFYMYSSILLTFLYVNVGWIFFHYDEKQLIAIFNLLI